MEHLEEIGNMKIPYENRYGFDNSLYVKKQADAIIERAKKFDKLYLEFGGKLVYDFHAARVLPGYELNTKIKVIKELQKIKKLEFLICINSDALEKEQLLGSINITYRDFSLKMISDLRNMGFEVNTAVMNFFKNQEKAKAFSELIKKMGIKVYFMPYINGYPNNVNEVLRVFGKKPFINTRRDIVIVTGAGPNSGKMATSLAMVYQDHLRGFDSGYAKFETFPVWNLNLDSMINVAYEAATADIGDYNVIDPYYKKAYNKIAVNYNRDVKTFSLLKTLIKSIISDKNFMRNYKSPTDMGINKVKDAIKDIKLCERAARQEIIRRYYRYYCDFLKGKAEKNAYERVIKIMKKHNISLDEIDVAKIIKHKVKTDRVCCAVKINKKIFIAYNSPNMHAEAGAIVKALKYLSSINQKKEVLWQNAIEKVKEMRTLIYKDKEENLNIKEMLLVLAISSAKIKEAKKALSNIKALAGMELHTTHMLSDEEEALLLKLGINATSEGKRFFKALYF